MRFYMPPINTHVATNNKGVSECLTAPRLNLGRVEKGILLRTDVDSEVEISQKI